MVSRDPSRLLVELSQVLRESPDGAALRYGCADAVETTVSPRPRDLPADFSGADKYSSFYVYGQLSLPSPYHGFHGPGTIRFVVINQ